MHAISAQSAMIRRFTRLARTAAGVATTVAAAMSSGAAAHDFWIEPTAFLVREGQGVGLRFRVGEFLAGEPLPFIPARASRFLVHEGNAIKPIVGRAGADLAGMVASDAPGLLVVGYQSRPSRIELDADKFETYLREEGLDSVVAQRAARKQTRAEVREIFSRYAKSLVAAGPQTAAMNDRRLGLPFELVAERNPYLLRDGDVLPLRLTYDDRPLAGTLVMALNTRNPLDWRTARTDGDGRVLLKLKPGGMWLVKAVHMIEAPKGSGAEWASFWASLTFEIPGANALKKMGPPSRLRTLS
jgi:uncharacterized GH25 family protein